MDRLEIKLKEIGQRIREARLAKKMSQEELADEVKLSTPNVSDIETGKSNFRVTSLIAICEVLEVSADSILRPDLPNVNAMYQTEFHSLLSDCSPAEMETLIKLVENVKTTLRSNN